MGTETTMFTLGNNRTLIQTSTSGAASLVAAQGAGVQIRVTDLWIMASAAVNVKFASSTAGDLTGLMYFAANGGIVLPHNERGWFATTANEALNINLSGAVAVGGCIHWVKITS